VNGFELNRTCDARAIAGKAPKAAINSRRFMRAIVGQIWNILLNYRYRLLRLIAKGYSKSASGDC
jgi:hypothetical protein